MQHLNKKEEWDALLCRLKRNLLVSGFDSNEEGSVRVQQRCRGRAADGIMTRVPQMTRDAYLMAHLRPTPIVLLLRVRARGA